MTPATPDLKTLAARLEAICDRLDQLEFQVRGLMTSQIVEAKEFVLRDERGEIRARLERAYIARLEIGRHDPTLSTLEKLAKALKVKVGKLLE